MLWSGLWSVLWSVRQIKWLTLCKGVLVAGLAWGSVTLVEAANSPAVPVYVSTVQQMKLAQLFTVSGTVKSLNNAAISARIDGQLTSSAMVGTRVKKGDTLAVLVDEVLVLKEKEQRAVIDNIRHKLAFLKSEVQRLKSLAVNSLTSKTTLDERSAELGQSSADLVAAQAQLQQIETQITYLTIIAPFDGLVSQRFAHQGELVSSGEKVVQLVDTKSLEISANLPLSTYPFVKVNQQVAVSSVLGEVNAPIRILIPVADERSRLMEVRIDMSSHHWPVGLNVQVAVPNGPDQAVLAVPRDALVLRRAGASIFRIGKDNIAEQIFVKTGLGDGAFIEIIGGVKPGDRVVIRGAERLSNGQQVSINPSDHKLVEL